MIFAGTAGWALGAEAKPLFGEGASHLARYATRLTAVEINSSFYRPHRAGTYARWAGSVPEDFRFAVKLPRVLTHQARLRDSEKPLDEFGEQIAGLGEKLGPLLIQLPPSLDFHPSVAEKFLSAMRARFAGDLVIEPRHAGWFGQEANSLLEEFHIVRAIADPSPVSRFGNDRRESFKYFRLHGSPVMYRSNYSDATLKTLAAQLQNNDWCMFDNTAEGAAIRNALALREMLSAKRSP